MLIVVVNTARERNMMLLEGGRTFAMLHGKLLLRREDEILSSMDGEVDDRERIPDRHPDHAGAVERIGELVGAMVTSA